MKGEGRCEGKVSSPLMIPSPLSLWPPISPTHPPTHPSLLTCTPLPTPTHYIQSKVNVANIATKAEEKDHIKQASKNHISDATVASDTTPSYRTEVRLGKMHLVDLAGTVEYTFLHYLTYITLYLHNTIHILSQRYTYALQAASGLG